MKITRRQLRQIIRENLTIEVRDPDDRLSDLDYSPVSPDEPSNVIGPSDISAEDENKFNKTQKFPANTLKTSEKGIQVIKDAELFRKRLYDDKIATDESSGPWITSFGWNPWTGEQLPEDPNSGRLGGDNYDILKFEWYKNKMSKTKGVPTIGYGIAMNSPKRVQDYAHFLGDDPNAQGTHWVVPEAKGVDEENESWQGGNENRVRRDMTEGEADKLLRSMVELPEYAAGVRKRLGKTPITQDQFDALVSRAYNEGSGGPTIKAATAELKKGTPEGWLAASNVEAFSHSGHASRQKAEQDLMLSWKV